MKLDWYLSSLLPPLRTAPEGLRSLGYEHVTPNGVNSSALAWQDWQRFGPPQRHTQPRVAWLSLAMANLRPKRRRACRAAALQRSRE